MIKRFFSALAAIALLAVPACDELEKALNEEIPCTSIIFDEPTFMMTVGETKTLPVTVEPANTTDKLEWSSSDEETVSITDGVATAKQEGIASITVKAGNQLAGCRIVVQKAQGSEGGGDGKIEVTEIQLNKTEITVVTGLSEQLEVVKLLPENATEKTVVWESDNTDIALVIPQDATVNGVFYKGGRVTGKNPGTTIVRALAGVAKAECKVTVTSGGSVTIESLSIDPSPISLAIDEEKILTAVVTPSNAKAEVVWKIDNEKIAAVGSINEKQAKVQGLSAGKATVTATAGGKSATCEVTVTGGSGNVQVQSITLDKTTLKLEVGQSAQITATVLPENAHDKSIIWTTTDPYNAYVNGGKVTGYGVCEATITATSVSNPQVTATCKVSIVAAGSGGGGGETGIEAVDLGLPSGLKWGSMNVGASKPEDYGNHYAWGETETKTKYTTSNYKFGPVKYSEITLYSKYETKQGGDKKTVLEAEDDAASANLGNGWRMATFAEWKELRESCTWTWTQRNGINGMLVTGPNGKSIFLPASGVFQSSLGKKGTYGSYWTSTLASAEGMANAVDFYSGGNDKALIDRSTGLSVRPVKN
ncbi:MAG: Ig-like domain-containing protein [Bacteroidales bacterium]|nr:Ig-like domain-containing protein [Bacteroidales bacterium]